MHHRSANITLLLVLPLLVFMSACTDEGNGPEPPTAEERPLPDDIATIFDNRNCTNCHRDDNATYGLSLSSVSSIRAGYRYGSVVVPYSILYSHMLWHTNPDSMYDGPSFPPYMPYTASYEFDESNSLTEAEFEALKTWINSGAPDREGRPMWYDKQSQSHGKGFFLCSGSDLMGVVDGETGVVMRYIEVGTDPNFIENPHYVQQSPDGQYVYVTLIEGGAVEKYSTTTYERVARTSENLGEQVAHVEVSSDGRWLMVSNWVDDAGSGAQNAALDVAILDANTLQVTDKLTESSFVRPHGIALNDDFTVAYVGSNSGNRVRKINLDPSNGTFMDGFPDFIELAPPGNLNIYQLLLSEDGNTLYATCDGGDQGSASRIVVVDVSGPSMQVVEEELAQQGECPNGTGIYPRLMRIWNGKLFVVTVGPVCRPESRRDGALMVYDINGDGTLTWRKNIYGLAQRPRGMALDEDRQRLFVFGDGLGNNDWHHPPPDVSLPPGQYNVIDLTTLDNPVVETTYPQPVDVSSSCYGATFINP